MEEQEIYKVFVKTDINGCIIYINSSAFVNQDDNLIEIDEGTELNFKHAQTQYFEKPIYTEDGYPQYKLVEGKPVERSEEELDQDRLPAAKTKKIQKSKADLEAYLLSHPLAWTDGETYSITEEKQNQLMGTLIAAQLDGKKPEWNTSGGVCREWELSELSALAVAIKNRVKALVKYQQTQELAIKKAESLEELNQLDIDYSSIT